VGFTLENLDLIIRPPENAATRDAREYISFVFISGHSRDNFVKFPKSTGFKVFAVNGFITADQVM
jgi:hypothetical protein